MKKYLPFIFVALLFLCSLFFILLRYRDSMKKIDEERKELNAILGQMWAENKRWEDQSMCAQKVVTGRQIIPQRTCDRTKRIGRHWYHYTETLPQECRVFFRNIQTGDIIRIDFRDKSVFDRLVTGTKIDTVNWCDINRILPVSTNLK